VVEANLGKLRLILHSWHGLEWYAIERFPDMPGRCRRIGSLSIMVVGEVMAHQAYDR
jgi:hypothetical protein